MNEIAGLGVKLTLLLCYVDVLCQCNNGDLYLLFAFVKGYSDVGFIVCDFSKLTKKVTVEVYIFKCAIMYLRYIC